MTKAQAGRLGGLATVKKHGRSHMQAIGKKGAVQFHKLYHLSPIGLANFAITRRSDNVIVGYTNPLNWR